MHVLLALQVADAGFGEFVKAVAAIGLMPTLIVMMFWAYKQRTDAMMKYLEDQNKQLLDHVLRRRRS
ncbi:MAG TPA: hypothetical protein VJM12_22215 [Pyrinomonadaceae bacterium]|nr:hypothetical protein [Pyrinomonadaceae bacterium]